MTYTHTFVTMAVSNAAFDEIKGILLANGYSHAVDASRQTLDMHGIALVREREADASNSEPAAKAD